MTRCDCPFCADFNASDGRQNILLDRRGDLVVLADFAPISPGHLLICPVEHHTSLANTPAGLRRQALDLALDLAAREQADGRPAIVSEHGTGVTGGASNACCDHAHLHIVPLNGPEQVEALAGRYEEAGGPGEILDRPDALDVLRGQPYNLLSGPGLPLRIWRSIDRFYPQFSRSAACRALGYSASDPRHLWQTSVDRLAALEGTLGARKLLTGADATWRRPAKLVRDGVPAVIAGNGEEAVYTTLSGDSRRQALIAKVREELGEFTAAPSLEEAADLLEAVRGLAADEGLAWQDVLAAMQDKAERLGGFDRAVFLELVLAEIGATEA